jgi:hypothetical protein
LEKVKMIFSKEEWNMIHVAVSLHVGGVDPVDMEAWSELSKKVEDSLPSMAWAKLFPK